MRQAMFLSYAFNENQNLCGSSDKDFHEFITPGSFVDIVIKQKEGPGEQATSLQIIPTTNALCIAYITQTWADGTHRGWMGDIGRGCHKEWYYSNMVVGDDYKPTCTWVDNDHSHAITTAALQINMQDFSNVTGDYNKDPDFYCQHPTMLFKPHTQDHTWSDKHSTKPEKSTFWTDTNPSSLTTNRIENDEASIPAKRNQQPSKRSGLAAFSHLIASPHSRHSARELCGSESSRGPDFFSRPEGVLCDMDTKTVWPLCDGSGDGGGCFDWDERSLALGEEGRMARGYSRVVEWE